MEAYFLFLLFSLLLPEPLAKIEKKRKEIVWAQPLARASKFPLSLALGAGSGREGFIRR